MSKKDVYIVVTFKFKKENKNWTAYCEELGTATFAETLDEAKEKIKEAVLLHLNTLEDVGERENFFAENNIKIYEHKPKRKDIQVSGPFDPETLITPYIYPIHRELLGI